MAKNNSIIGILINIQKAGNGDKAAIASLKNLQKTINDATAIFGTLAGAAFTVAQAYDKTVGEFIRYADTVQSVMNATGLQAEEASRLLQVTDDLGVSEETLTKAMIQMAKNGIDPSINGLAALSAKYQQLAPGVERVQFLTDTFGKSGANMARVMETGSDSLLEMNDAVNKNLILSNQQIALAHQQQLAVDELSEAWQGFAVQSGSKIAPALTALLNGLSESSSQTMNWNKFLIGAGDDIVKSYQEVTATITDTTGVIYGVSPAAREAAEAEYELADANKEVAQSNAILTAALSGDVQNAYRDYNSGMAESRQKAAELQAQIDQLTAEGVDKNADAIADLNKQLEDTVQEQKDLAAATQLAIAKMIYQQAAAGLDARASLQLARSLGLVSEADYAIASAIQELKDRRDAEIAATGDAEKANQKYIQSVQELNNLVAGLEGTHVVNVVTNYITNGTPPDTGGDGGSGGGGSGECFLAGTLVDTPNGPRAIETLKEGEEVVSMATERGDRVITRIVRTFHHRAEQNHGYLVINKFLKVTPNHPIYTSQGYKAAGELVLGEPIRAWNGWAFVQKIEPVLTPVDTYNIETDHPSHNYFADGILVHNKDSQGYASGGLSYGPSTGHMELLHGNEAVFTQTQFSDMVNAFRMLTTGGVAAGGAPTIIVQNMTVDGRMGYGEFMQAVNDSAPRRL